MAYQLTLKVSTMTHTTSLVNNPMLKGTIIINLDLLPPSTNSKSDTSYLLN